MNKSQINKALRHMAINKNIRYMAPSDHRLILLKAGLPSGGGGGPDGLGCLGLKLFLELFILGLQC
jgi:hypothetical protein